jgi:hypothetical protein
MSTAGCAARQDCWRRGAARQDRAVEHISASENVEQVLAGGNVAAGVVRVGGTVRKPAHLDAWRRALG